MSTPPTRRIQSRYSRRNAPAALNEAPSATKTTEKPITKVTACSITRRRTADVRSALRSDTDIPVTKDRYEGKSGSTHGDRNENSPALNATTTPSGSLIGDSILRRVTGWRRYPSSADQGPARRDTPHGRR